MDFPPWLWWEVVLCVSIIILILKMAIVLCVLGLKLTGNINYNAGPLSLLLERKKEKDCEEGGAKGEGGDFGCTTESGKDIATQTEDILAQTESTQTESRKDVATGTEERLEEWKEERMETASLNSLFLKK